MLVRTMAAGGALQLLSLIVFENRTQEILLTDELLDAVEAERYGLINRVGGKGDVEMETLALLQQILDRNSPQVYSVMKMWTNFAVLHSEMARDITAQVWTPRSSTIGRNVPRRRGLLPHLSGRVPPNER